MSAAAWRRIPRGVWALGVVSLLMDVSSEMVHGLLPVFLVSVLGAGALAVGAIEGLGEGTAAAAKLFSGVFSDRMGRRKPLALLGYGLAAAVKPIFPLALGAGDVALARFLDRVGKGVRGPPRDALVGDLAPADLRGASFGLRQSLDSIGALLGPLLAVVLVLAAAGDIRAVFWLAAIPAWLAVLVLWAAVNEPARATAPAGPKPKIDWRAAGDLGRGFWIVIALAGAMMLARFSEAFLILRGLELGMTASLAPLVLALFSAAYAATAYPLGALSDRVGRLRLLAAGMGVLVLGDLALAAPAGGLAAALLGVALWGVHMGMTQGLLAALVADSAPARLRGTGFGVYHAVTAAALFFASLGAGAIWELVGSQACFLAGAVVAAIGALGFALVRSPGFANK
ncbi:MAG: MFS transporter [Rhodospirillales bacterium]